MCEPMTMLAIASTVVGGMGAKNAAEDQMQAQNEAAYTTMQQNNAAASQDKFLREKDAQAERARIRAAAGESGIAGNSVLGLLTDSYMQAGMDKADVEYNRQNKNTSITQSTIARNTAAKNSVPSGFETGLAIAGSVADYDTRTGKVSEFFKKSSTK